MAAFARGARAGVVAHPIRAAVGGVLVLAVVISSLAFLHVRSAETYLMPDSQQPQIYSGFGQTALRVGDTFKLRVVVPSVSHDATLILHPVTFPQLQRHLRITSQRAELINLPLPGRTYTQSYVGPVQSPRNIDGFRLPPGQTALITVAIAADQPGTYVLGPVTVHADAPPMLGLPNPIAITYSIQNTMCVEVSQQTCEAFGQTAFASPTVQAREPVQLWNGSSPALQGVAALSPDDVWAVGDLGIILHHAHGAWTQVANPAGPKQLHAITMLSPSDGWAVGDQGTILHYSGGAWKDVSFHTSANLYAIAMLSSAEGWIAGNDNTILHGTGGNWQSVPAPQGLAMVGGIAMRSPTDVWITTDRGFLHYNGSAWRKSGPALSQFPGGITLLSPTDGWGVGSNILHFDGTTWKPAGDQPGSELLRGIAMTSATNGWAVGGQEHGPSGSETAALLYYSGGRWQQVDSPTDAGLFAVAMDSPSDGWAVGAGVILHYTGGAWHVVSGPIDVHGA
jgi:photosystem II stability/assembly factor-like uncharacterized protein